MNKLLLTSAMALTVLAFGRSDGADAPSLTLYERLEGTTALECRFTVMSAGSWEGATPKTEVTAKELNLTYENVNVDEGTADANSQFGDFYVAVRYTTGYLHLMQMFRSGPLYTTTVLARETADGRMMAIHARHEYTPTSVPGFTSRPEMYLGDCAVTN